MKVAVLSLVLAVCFGTMLSLTAMAADGVKTGQAAPAFTLKDQTGKEVSLADYSGKVVVLEWFNNECPFVVKHYKDGHMNKLAAKYAEQGVVWLAVDSTKNHNQANAVKIAAEWNISRPILDDSAGTVGHAYGATNTPHLYVINKEGKIVYHGAIDSDSSDETSKIDGATNYVASALDEVLAGKTVSKSETKAYGCSVKYAKK